MLVTGFQIGAPHFGHTLTLVNDIDSPMLFNSMGKSEKLVETFVRRTVKEEIDKALALSDKRRKEFQGEFAQVFTEADAAQPPAPDPAADPNAPPAPPVDPAAPGAPPAGDPTAAAPGADPAAGDPAGGPGGTPGGDPADPDAPVDGEDPAGADAGGGGGGGGLGGFGGGGGGGGGGGDDMGGAEAPEAPEPTEPEAPVGDPIESMLAGAQELLNQTQDPNLILKSLKGQIQTLFQQPEHALGLVKALYDTQDSLLQAVAQRLYLFIKTSRPQ